MVTIDIKMSFLKKLVQISAAAAFILLFNFLHRLNAGDRSGSRPKAGATGKHNEIWLDSSTWSLNRHRLNPRLRGYLDPTTNALSSRFRSGTPKPPGSAYSQVMVVPRLKDDDISWIQEELPGFDTAVYVANDPIAPLHPPRNKGHEVMVYLTYIIDHYDDLPDIIVFMHAHRWTHHNTELLGYDSAEMVRRLSSDYVTSEGYVNMRCQWSPGCPEWLHPNDSEEILAKQEQVVLSKCWRELFPQDPLPDSLGQACCAQFALSKERIQSIPLSRFVFHRDWILRTPLSDYVSGRIWEYLWQYLFTGRTIYCPSEYECHCRGFGVCFGGEAEYKVGSRQHFIPSFAYPFGLGLQLLAPFAAN